MNPVQQLATLGQSIWLDDIRRDLITGGELRRLIEQDGLCGMTSNPAIFEKAISQSHAYDEDIKDLATQGKTSLEIYETLSQEDVRGAADAFRPLHDQTDGRDGYVSLEVNPHLAHDTHGTVQEARRLWITLNRPNVLIKVPATSEGLPAIEQLIAEGISVNVTLIFGRARYQQVAEAYLRGLETRASRGLDLRHVASVASLFVSRMDAMVDPLLQAIVAAGGETADGAREALGQAAIANAKLAYQLYKSIHGSARFKRLEAQGARSQRLLWASTGTKDPAYGDVKYVEALIGPETVNTLPSDTLEAYRDHGRPEARLELDVEESERIVNLLPQLGVDLDQICERLEAEGIAKFNQPFDQLLNALSQRAPPVTP